MEAAEVKKKDQADHAYPSPEQRMIDRYLAGDDPEQHDSECRFCTGPKPLRNQGSPDAIAWAQESFGVHAGPGRQVCNRTSEIRLQAIACCPPGRPFQGSKYGKA